MMSPQMRTNYTCRYDLSRLIVVLSVLFSSFPLHADTTEASLRELDRFFTTRFQRAELDAQRGRNSGQTDAGANTNAIQVIPVQVEMKGIMQREKGKSVTWVNDGNTLESNAINDNIRVGSKPQALGGARVSVNGKQVKLKPGQVYQQFDDKVVERYQTKPAAPVTSGADNIEQTGQTDTGQ